MTDFDDSQFDQFDEFDEEEPTPASKPGNRTFIIAIGALVSVFLIVVIGIVVYLAFVHPQNKIANEQREATVNAQNTAIVLQATQTVMAVAMNQAQAATGQASIKTLTAAASAAQNATKAASPTAMVMASATQAASATLIPTTTQVMALPSDTPAPAATATLSQAEILQNDPAAGTATARAVMTIAALGGTPLATAGPGMQLEAMTSTPRVELKTPTARATLTALPNTGFADEVGLPLLFGGAVLLLVVIFFSRRLRASIH